MSRLPGIVHCLHCISRCSLAPSSWMPLIWCTVGEHTRARDGGVCNGDGRLHFMRQQEEIGSTRYTSSAHEMTNKLNERNVNDACRSFSCSDMNAEFGSVKNCDDEAVAEASEDFQTFSDELPKAQGREELENELSRRIESIIKRCESSDTERTTLGRLSGVEFDEQPKVDLNFDFNADFDKLEFHENGNSILLAEKNEENNFTDNSQQLGKITDSEINTASLDNRVTIQDDSPLVDTNDASATPSAQLTKCSTEFSEASRRIGELHVAMLKVMNHSESLKHLSNEFKALALSKNEDTQRLDSSNSTIQRNDIKEDFIPAYKPFQTIEVPVAGAEGDEEANVSKPAADVSGESKASRDTKESHESHENHESHESNASVVNKSGRTVIDTNMNDPQSKQIMRYALLRALQRLEDGTGYFSAKIIITDP